MSRKSDVKVTVGHDAEVFLVDDEDNFIPAIDLVGGTKENPRQVMGGALQEDNVMAELNITPAHTPEEFADKTEIVLEQLNEEVAQRGLRTKICESATFHENLLFTDKAMEFGCDPDINIYTFEKNEVDNNELIEKNLRTCGGHIHVGLESIDEHPRMREWLVWGMDLFVGLPLTLMEPGNNLRRKYYGKAGAHRVKPYGIEYRVPSNYWLTNRKLMEWVAYQTRSVAFQVHSQRNNNMFIKKMRSIGKEKIQEIINNKQQYSAAAYTKHLRIKYPKSV